MRQVNNIEKKTWWLVRDNFRGQAYNMKANMLAINKVLEGDKKAAAGKAYSKFWSEVNQCAPCRHNHRTGRRAPRARHRSPHARSTIARFSLTARPHPCRLDLAVSKKELELAKKEYEDCMGALAEYEAIVL